MPNNRRQSNNDPSKLLLIKLQELEIRPQHKIRSDEDVYYSFSYGEKMYFSSVMDSNQLNLVDDMIIPLNSPNIPENIEMHRWQNHMIMFTHQIDLSDLKTRSSVKKSQETMAGQVVSFMFIVLTEDEIKFGNKYVQSITQHYLIFESFQLKSQKNNLIGDESGPSYFMLRTSQTDYVMPVIDGEICIKVPQTVEFEHFRSGKLAGRSKKYQTNQLSKQLMEVNLSGKNGNPDSVLCFSNKWAINLSQAKPENTLLLDSNEIYIYDFQIKFDNYNQFANSKVKFIYGNKAFEAGSQFNSPKLAKFKKIMHFILKSESEEINIIAERNLKAAAQCKFYTDQILSHTVANLKKKLIDNNGKAIGTIKFKSQKGRNLSTPSNNKLWKENAKKKTNYNVIVLSLSQFSVNYPHNEEVSVIVKTEAEEKIFPNVPNFQFFDKGVEVSTVPLVVSTKAEDSVYLMVKNATPRKKMVEDPDQNTIQRGQTDFIGIAILNFSQLKLGMNSARIPFFKNQEKTVTVNCLVNKVVAYPFVKSTFQPQNLHSHAHKTLSLSILLKKVQLSPFFFTFRYDNKNELYCIVEVNRLKKVLIMQESAHNQLVFVSSAGSDSLNFIIEDTQFIKVKVTFLVSDIGYDEEIYGSALIKMKTAQLINHGEFGLSFSKIQIKNQFGTEVGHISTEVQKGSLANSSQKMINGNIKDQRDVLDSSPALLKSRVKQNMDNIYIKDQLQERKFHRRTPQNHKSVNPIRNHIIQGSIELKKPSIRYDNNVSYGRQKQIQNQRKKRNKSVNMSKQYVNLPKIKAKEGSINANNLKNLIQMMKIRKKTTKGNYEENSTIQSYKFRDALSERQKKKDVERHFKMLTSQDERGIVNISKEKIQRENPNLERNLQILFPKKGGSNERKQHLQRQINDYEQKLKGLKSVYEQISQQIGQITPSVKEQGNLSRQLQGPQWQDNQFALPH